MKIKKTALAGLAYKNRHRIPVKARKVIYAVLVVLAVVVLIVIIGFVAIINWIISSF